MLLVSAKWRASRREGRPGRVLLTVMEGRRSFSVALGMVSSREEMFSVNHARIEWYMRLFYALYMRMRAEGTACVVERFREMVETGRFDEDLTAEAEHWPGYDPEVMSFGRGFMVGEETLKASESEDTLTGFIARLADRFEREGRIFTARNFRSTRNSVRSFIGDVPFGLRDVGPGFVKDYEAFLAAKGISRDTVAFYLRMLRIVLSHAGRECASWFESVSTTAVSRGELREERVLGSELLRRISAMNLEADAKQALSRDIFMFSFYMRGLEFADIAQLRRENVMADGYLVFRRRQKGRVCRIRISAGARAIIDRYGSDRAGAYLFPLGLQDGRNKMPCARGKLARHLKEIGDKVGCPGLTLNMTRATWQAMVEEASLSEALLPA